MKERALGQCSISSRISPTPISWLSTLYLSSTLLPKNKGTQKWVPEIMPLYSATGWHIVVEQQRSPCSFASLDFSKFAISKSPKHCITNRHNWTTFDYFSNLSILLHKQNISFHLSHECVSMVQGLRCPHEPRLLEYCGRGGVYHAATQEKGESEYSGDLDFARPRRAGYHGSKG